MGQYGRCSPVVVVVSQGRECIEHFQVVYRGLGRDAEAAIIRKNLVGMIHGQQMSTRYKIHQLETLNIVPITKRAKSEVVPVA